MKIKVINKKRFGLSCIFLLLLIILFSKLLGTLLNSKKGQAVLNNIALAADKNGSITLEENEFYKRYTINCNKAMEKAIWEDNKEFVEVSIMKDSIDNVGIKSEGKVQDKSITYDKNENRLIVKFKKDFSESNYVYLDNSNKKKVIILISKKKTPYNHVVVLDPGHGGNDKGTNYKNIYEKDITLKIANYVEQDLRWKGYKVIKTRDEDKYLELKDIGKITNAANAELFVSVHINSNKESKYKGATTYYYFNTNGDQKDERMALAKTIQKEIVKSDNWDDRGILKENYAVLRYSNIPAVLIECGFLSNSEDREKLTKEDVLKNFGINISNGISNYITSAKNKSNTDKNK